MIAIVPDRNVGASRSATITAAAAWLASLPADQRPHPVVRELRLRFDLSPLEAVQAIREAGIIARAH